MEGGNIYIAAKVPDTVFGACQSDLIQEDIDETGSR